MNDKIKQTLKDIRILLSLFVPIVLLIVGHLKWKDGDFEGTIMQDLYPALLLGFAFAWIVVLLVSNIFKHNSIIWWICGIITFLTIVITYMFFIDIAVIIIISLVALTLVFIAVKSLLDKLAE